MPAASNGLPGGYGGTGRPFLPTRPFTGWGLPCRECHHCPRWSLTPPFHPCRPAFRAGVGGLFSVALSLSLRTVAVSHHPALRCPDFPRGRPKPDPATIYPPSGSLLVKLALHSNAPQSGVGSSRHVHGRAATQGRPYKGSGRFGRPHRPHARCSPSPCRGAPMCAPYRSPTCWLRPRVVAQPANLRTAA